MFCNLGQVHPQTLSKLLLKALSKLHCQSRTAKSKKTKLHLSSLVLYGFVNQQQHERNYFYWDYRKYLAHIFMIKYLIENDCS